MSIFGSLTKAALNVVAAPIALVVDVVTLPVSSTELHKGPFDRTANCLNRAAESTNDALEGK